MRKGLIDGLKIEKLIPVSDWADEHRILNSASSPEPGYWKTSRTPYLKEIMNCLSPLSDVESVAWIKGTQVGATEAGNNWVAYTIDMTPGPMMLVQPTQGLAKRYSKQRLAPMIADMPILRDKISPARSRDSGNTTLFKEFYGGAIAITGANSAAELRSMPARYLFLDEVDGYPINVDGEGDPIELAINRTKNFFNRKIFMVSTPTTESVSRIEKEFKKGDQRYYHVPCPHCKHMQNLNWKNIKWQKRADGTPAKTIYVCIGCGAEIEEEFKTQIMSLGKWIPANPNTHNKKRSYHLNALYSPLGWTSWQSIATKFVEAKNDPELLKTWTNTQMAETFKESVNEFNASDIQNRSEQYPLRVAPEKSLLMTAGVDVQDNRLELTLYAWGKGEEAWAIDNMIFDGDPGSHEVWTDLYEYLITPVPHQKGGNLNISATAIDTGGHHTHETYNFCRTNTHLGVMAIKGASVRNKPILSRAAMVDVNIKGRTIKNGVKLWLIGTDTAKSTIFSRLRKPKTAETNPGYIHFSDELPTEFFDQIVAEKYAARYIRGKKIYEWVNPTRSRNEALDCTVYAYAAALKIGIHRWGKAKWTELESRLGLSQTDMFNNPVETRKTKTKVKKIKHRKKGELW